MIPQKKQPDQQNNIQNPENTTANVYLRFASAKSLKISLPVVNSVDQIKAKIQQLTDIKAQNQILFYRGQQLLGTSPVKLKEKAIIHIKNKKQNLEDITVHVIKHLPQQRNIFKLNFQYTPFKVNPQQIIEEALTGILSDSDQTIDYKRTKVIQCGRFLKLHKTFAEQKIQGLTEIHLIFRKRLQQNQVENDKDQKLLIESVLKKSAHNSATAREREKERERERESKTERIFAKLDEQYEQQKQKQIQKVKEEDSERKEQEEFEVRRSLPNYCSATKASEFWQSHKFIRKELTPLKFSFRDYKKYDGPKSVRDCNCKRRTEFYQICQQHQSESGQKQSPVESSSPKESRLRSSKVLKTRASMFF